MRLFLPLRNIFKTAGPICERVPCSCRDRTLFAGGGVGGGVQRVGVNYANKFSDTNLDGDSVKEELAEGGIVHTVAVVVVVVAGPPPLPHTPCSLP